MDELVLSCDNLKQQLLCSFCNELVDNSYKFIACSHIFCHKHLKSTQLKKCFACHKGDIKDVVEDDDVNQMVYDYKELVNLLLGNGKENVIDNIAASDNVILTKKRSKQSKKENLDTNEPAAKTDNICSDKRTLRNNKNQIKNKLSSKNNPSKKTQQVQSHSKEVEKVQDQIKKVEQVQDHVKKVENVQDYTKKVEQVRDVSKKIVNEASLKTPTLGDVGSKLDKQKKTSPKVAKQNVEKKSTKTDKVKQNISLGNDSILDSSSSNLGANLMKRNKKGETCLHSACVQNKMEEVKSLLKEGLSPNSKDNAGWTPLHEAVAGGNQNLVELLLQYGALPQVPGPHYETPLHEAVRLGYSNIIKLLIESGASMHARNDKGQTPFAVASDNVKELLQSLEKCSASKPHDISLSVQNNRTFVILSLLTKKENITKFQKLVKKHDNMKCVSEFSKNVTHILIESENGSCSVVQETLLAVVNGKAIISSDWLAACSDSSLADVVGFYLTNLGGATECIHLSLMNKLNLIPGLFAGCYFYFIGFNSKYEISARLTIKKPFLCQLVTEGDGIVLRREPNPESIPENEQVLPYHALPGSPLEFCAHYIIYQNRPPLAYNMRHIKSLPVAWLIECIQNFKLVDP